jgi:hypothetical protein
MPIQHKFHHRNFGNGFQSNNAILDILPYKPEIMIIGTFNPDTPNANFADFFYGRNYFWTAFKNLFSYNQVILTKTRMPRRGIPQASLNPTLPEILQLCSLLKLTFADLINEVLQQNNPIYELLQNDNVHFNGFEYNLIQDGQMKNIGGLQQLNLLGQVSWNTNNIINYLCENTQIKTIYLTRQPTGVWEEQWHIISSHSCMIGRQMTNIFTPSGQSLKGKPRMNALINHWVHNNTENFGRMDNDWLLDKGVNINNFRI